MSNPRITDCTSLVCAVILSNRITQISEEQHSSSLNTRFSFFLFRLRFIYFFYSFPPSVASMNNSLRSIGSMLTLVLKAKECLFHPSTFRPSLFQPDIELIKQSFATPPLISVFWDLNIWERNAFCFFFFPGLWLYIDRDLFPAIEICLCI